MGLLTHSSRRSLPSHWRLRVTTRGSSESVPAGKVQRGPGIASPRQDRLRSGRCCLPIRFGPLPSGFLNGVCGVVDDIEYEGGVREHGDVAAGGLDGDGSPMRFATKRSSSGCTVRSLVATMYQLGFDLQAVPPTFWLNRSAAGAAWVAYTSFCSSSGRSPAKHATPSGRIQTRPSATST